MNEKIDGSIVKDVKRNRGVVIIVIINK